MQLRVITPEGVPLASVQDVVWLFWPGADLVSDRAQAVLTIEVSTVPPKIIATYQTGERRLRFCQKSDIQDFEDANELKRLARLAVFYLLCEVCQRVPSPWGIFTGVRPTKIVHRLIEQGLSTSEVINRLIADYALRQDRAVLITEIAQRQRPFFSPSSGQRLVSVYIGIPFCPSKCHYCSFLSYPMTGRSGRFLQVYLSALGHEIDQIGAALSSINADVESIYIGGGTPTVLSEALLNWLMEKINQYLRGPRTLEITMEAGRPDTLSYSKLKVCHEAGVNRISINPQTLHQDTLHAIGRNHSVEEVFQSFEYAREVGFSVINMDVIVGLPGETPAHVQKTLEGILTLRPENLTVHTLAIKNSSRLKEAQVNYCLPSEENTQKMWEIARHLALSAGMVPYYMYRQKRMLGNLDNIGYALPGKECIYNIQMIEERQTVVGIGAGAGSKWVDLNYYLVNQYNPKDLHQYTERLPYLIARKIDKILAFR